MGKIVVNMHMTLDGVIQAPGRPDEDMRNGFQYGGWAMPNNDEVMGRVMGKEMSQCAALLPGRITYEDFFGFWPKQKNNPYTEVLANIPKYVASNTLTQPLPWQNSTLLTGDVVEAVAKLKAQSEKDIAILGSGALVQSLMHHNLIDKYVLMIHPLVLGAGRRLFQDGMPPSKFRLAESVATTTGVIIAIYQSAVASLEF